MKTTIVIEDAGALQIAGGTTDAPPAAPPAQADDAGAAPHADSTAPSNGHAYDGGVPPAWLVDGIAAAGGMKAPLSPESIHLGADDGGAAPPA